MFGSKGDFSMKLSQFVMALTCLAAAVASCVPAYAQEQAAASGSRVTPVVQAYRKARPAVVNISAEKVVTTGIFGQDPFEDIFPSPLTRRVPVQSLGSGVIIHSSGYIATNAHVVRKAEKITVIFADGTQLPAKIIVSDGAHDLAVLKVEAADNKPLPYLPLGRSDDLMVGETVIAIGNAMGYSNSVTTGVISATNRTLEFAENIKYEGLIQTDAPINPGNSGGPLLNINGELIGINTAIRADAQNIGFAIPTDSLASQLAILLDFERINRVIFGASVSTRHGQAGDGFFVSAIRKGTPADGLLKEGDILTKLAGQPLRQIPDFCCTMLAVKGGQKLSLGVLRAGKETAVEITLATKPRPDGKMLAENLFGMTLRPVTPELAREMRLLVDKGLVVVGLDEAGAAAKLGIQVKDVLFQVDQFYVTDLDELGMVLEEFKPGQVTRIGIVRRNVRAWVNMATGRPAAPPARIRPKDAI